MPAIVARGVRVHNLKGIDVVVPTRRLVAITGVSGAGKSSLAFDTLYAEGRRRYVEGLSAHARHFLERLERPEVDSMEGVCPAVALRRRPGARSPRATLATAAELHELLGAMFTEKGEALCPACGGRAGKDDAVSATDAVLEQALAQTAVVAFAPGAPLSAEDLPRLAARGYRRLLVQETTLSLEEAEAREADAAGALIVVDRIGLAPPARARLTEALEVAMREGSGIAWVQLPGDRLRFAEAFSCRACGTGVEEPRPRLFSFNDPAGACPECHGFGNVAELDPERVVPDSARSLAEGAIEPWSRPRYRMLRARLRRFCREKGIPWSTPWARLTSEQREAVFHGGDGFAGVVGFFRRLERKKYRVHVRVLISRYRRYRPCPSCAGSRLRPEARAVRVGGRSLDEVCRLTVRQALAFVESLPDGPPDGVLARLRKRLALVMEAGLGHLALDRPLGTLSAGEAQRVALAAALGSGLAGALYVLEEPAAGLHPQDVERLAGALLRLRDLGNTVLLVEHDARLVRTADHVIDLGPGAGEQGGRIVFAGSPCDLERETRSLTGKFLRGELSVPRPERRRRVRSRLLHVRGARANNLKGIDVALPLGALTCVTGVSGAGKSTLLREVQAAFAADPERWRRGPPRPALEGAEGIEQVVLLDDSPVGRTPRSNAVTYVKALDPVRELFAATAQARALSLGAADFSFNVPGGRCEACGGAGGLVLDLHFMGDAVLPCESCGGRRFRPSVLEVRYRGRTIHDVLQMTVQEAVHFFSGQPKVAERLRPLAEVGLSYLRLGQPASTLSSGEGQRLRLAAALERPKARSLFLLDEPTTGLHPADVADVLRALGRLIAEGATVVAVAHDMDVVKQADWVLELGPEAGPGGGHLLYQGAPEGLAEADCPSGPYLRAAILGDGGLAPSAAVLPA